MKRVFFWTLALITVLASFSSTAFAAATTVAPAAAPVRYAAPANIIDVAAGDNTSVNVHSTTISSDWLLEPLDYGYVSAGYGSPDKPRWGTGLRFAAVNMPRNATITGAYLTFVAIANLSTTTVNTRIVGDKEPDAAAFSTLADYQARRGTDAGGADNSRRTTAQVSWDNITAWTQDAQYQSPDISAVIQEIVGQTGWASGNHVALFWGDHEGRSSTTDNLTARMAYSSVNATGNSPQLHIEWVLTPPQVTTDAATGIGYTSALLNGGLTGLGTATSANLSFEWGLSPGSLTNPTSAQTANVTGVFSANVTGLSPATTYYYRAKAVGDGSGYGGVNSFTTLSDLPTVVTGNVTNVGTVSARLNGDLTGLGTATSANLTFLWGLAADNLGQQTTAQSANATGSFFFDLSGLTENTIYYYRAKAVGHGTALGAVVNNFTTLPVGPLVTTDNPTVINYSSARLKGTLTSLGTAGSANVSFQWGRAPGSYTGQTTAQSVSVTGAFSFDLTGVSPSLTYYYRAKAVGNGTRYGAEKSFTTPEEPAPAPPPSGGGFGGGGSSGGGGVSGPGATLLSQYTNDEGLFNLGAVVKSDDGKVSLSIVKGVRAQNKDGTALRSIKIVPMDTQPTSIEGGKFISLAYEITPEGATFSPVISLSISYNLATLPQNIDLNSLGIVVFNAAASRWDPVESAHDKASATVAANISHFSSYALVGKAALPPTTPPPPAPAPARFSVSDLTVDPVLASSGQTVNVAVKASNAGGTAGDYEVALQVNGAAETTKKVTIAAGSSSTVSFTVTRSNAGDYGVSVNGLTGSFTVRQVQPTSTPPSTSPTQTPVPTQPGKGTNWLLIIVIAIVAVVIIIGVVMVRRRRKPA